MSNGPEGAGEPVVPLPRQESGTQEGVTAQVAGNSGAVTGARSSVDV